MLPSYLLLCLCFLADDESKPPAKSSWIAPSLPATTKEQERAFDAIIDRFILADTGRLRGAEAKEAMEAFDKLGPVAIPALLRGLNKAATINHSCPILMISRKLSKMLLSSQDPILLEFARDELQASARKTIHATAVENLRVQLMLRKNALERLPIAPRSLEKIATDGLITMSNSERGERRKTVLAELAKRDGREAMLALARAAGSADRGMQAIGRAALDANLARQPESSIREALTDVAFEVRKSAIRVAITNRELIWHVIDRVTDERADVRAEARAALVQFAEKKVDFGPLPGATKAQQNEAKKQWRAWWEKQQPGENGSPGR
jgi:hypothetical protein